MKIRLSLVRFLPEPPPPEPEPEPESAPPVVPLVLRNATPCTWNLWDLERLADKMNGDAAASLKRLNRLNPSAINSSRTLSPNGTILATRRSTDM